MPTLSVSPNAAPPATTVDVDGSGFDPKFKFSLTTTDANGVEVGQATNTNRPRRDGTFKVGINVPPVEGQAIIKAYQRSVVVAQADVTVRVPVTPPPSTAAIIGTLEADSKDNRIIGRSDNQALGLRWKSTGGTVQRIGIDRRYGPDGAGYSAGTGGRIRVSIQAESSSGVPSGIRIGETIFDAHNTHDNSEDQNWIALTATFPAGWYFLVVENVDSNPGANWMSVNQLTVLETHPDPLQPTREPKDLDVFVRVGSGAWHLYTNNTGDGIPAPAAYKNTAALDIAFADGHHEGNGYASLIVDHYALIKGTSRARQTITVPSAITVTKAAIRVKRTSGSGGLTLALVDGSGATLASSVVPSSSVPQTPGPSSIGNNHWDEASLAGGRWAVATFPAVTLQPGQTYSLVASTDGATSYIAIPLRETKEQSTPPWGAPMFKGGQAEVSSGGAWSPLYEFAPVDYQFYLAS